jgi:uncharacterized membrane protein SpoIIM required for sporulation
VANRAISKTHFWKLLQHSERLHMQETDFILQNKEKWKEFEEVLKSPNKDPERMTELFIETTDDLSYSRTYYPNRSVRVYLNGISQMVYQAIYKNRSGEKNVFSKFWLEDLPTAMWHSRKALFWSFMLFVAGLAVGILSSMHYPAFANIMLGDSYVEMTEANIASGDPMAVYKGEEPFSMFFRIAWNNIRIAYGTFVLGILFGIGTVYVVFYNAIMVGAFIYFFIERNLFKESFLAIMLHGTLELSMIVVAGCAGFALARGLIFPGTYTRGQALVHSARNGIKILAGVTVLLLYAAIIESFATRYTEMPDIIRLGIILLSFIIVIGYFVIYPRKLQRKGLIPDLEQEEIPVKKHHQFQLHIIKSAGKIFTETFALFSANIRPISRVALLLSLLITLVFGIYTQWNFHEVFYQEGYRFNPFGLIYVWSMFDEITNFHAYPLMFLVYSAVFAINMFLVFRFTMQRLGIKNKTTITDVVNAMVITALILSTILLPAFITFFLAPLCIPFLIIWYYVAMQKKQFFLATFKHFRELCRGNMLKILGTFISSLAIQWIGLLLINSSVIELITQFLYLNLARYDWLATEIYYIINIFLPLFMLLFLMCFTMYGTTLLYYSLKEINEANSLKESIHQVGYKKRAYGLEQEG